MYPYNNLDTEWTKDETDYLFTIVKQYDQRWYVIYDRYQYPGGRERSLEVCITSVTLYNHS